MKIGNGHVFSLLNFVTFWLMLSAATGEVLQSTGVIDPSEHLDHWAVAMLFAVCLPRLWLNSIPPKKSAMYQNAQAAKAYRKGQRVEQMARGMAGTDAYRTPHDTQ